MIRVNLDRLLFSRRMSMQELAERTGISRKNLWMLKVDRAQGIRFSTLAALCDALGCAPGELLTHGPQPAPSVSPSEPVETLPLEAHQQAVLDAIQHEPVTPDEIID